MSTAIAICSVRVAKIIDRYISGQIFTTLIWTVCMLSLMLVVANAMRQLLELLMTHGLPLSYILSFIGDLLPFSMIYSIPWAYLSTSCSWFANFLLKTGLGLCAPRGLVLFASLRRDF